MPLRQKIFAIFVALAILIVIIDLVRRKKLKEEYSFLWILTGFTILLVVLWYDILVFLTKLIGAVLPTSTLFLLSIIFIIMILLHFSIRISTLTEQIKILTQELSILKTELSTKNKIHPPLYKNDRDN